METQAGSNQETDSKLEKLKSLHDEANKKID